MTGVLRTQIEYAYRTLKANVAGLSHEDSLVQPPSAAASHSVGNCLNWIAGHILATRGHLLELLGEPPVWSEAEAERYRRGSRPVTNPEDTVRLDKILADMEVSQRAILRSLEGLTPDWLAAGVPSDSGEERTLGSTLALIVFHEAYHVGQTGILRRIIGREGAIR